VLRGRTRHHQRKADLSLASTILNQCSKPSGSVSHLPFADQMFDLVTAAETHYYWPDMNADMQEVFTRIET
jgi:ubiquinone/menaquinone biosynthesis C-methylase UbiE